MGSLITETPYSEVTATLEILDHLGVGREDLRKFRAAVPEVQGHMASMFKTADTLVGISTTAMDQTPLIIEVDYEEPFEQMVAAGNYDWRNENLNEQNFSIKGKGKKRFECRLFDANCSSKKGVARIEAAGFKPGCTEHILRFGSTFPDLQRKHPIAGLGSTARVRGIVSVPCLRRGDAERDLGLAWWDDAWPDDWRLLGVREISGSPV